ncbi:MAG: flagellar transcriptional regulator FlhD [Nitrosomonadales bacterium]|jgi:flagellar transcriptional activator FlhD|nr:flagellar transcriptional regulator FlhD [Nitrosomonadales bacterium]
MSIENTLSEIRDINLNYLMLAQQMIREDKPSAIFRLGISKDIANLIDSLSNSQLTKLANAQMMLARFRFDDCSILNMLTNYNKDSALTNAHAVMLMSNQPVEAIA